MIKVVLAGLASGAHGRALVLLDREGRRALPVGVSGAQAWEIELVLREQSFGVPGVSGFVVDAIKASGAALEGVYITGLRAGMLQVVARVQSGDQTHDLPLTPADAVTLAATSRRPIYVEETVFEEAGVPATEPIRLSGPRGQLLDIEVLERIVEETAATIACNLLGAYPVIDGLYLGKDATVRYGGVLREVGITHVLSLGIAGPVWPADFVNLENAINDRQPVPKERFEKGVAFIHEHLEAGRRVLAACTLGIKRSPVLAMAYLIDKRGYELREAWDLVQSRRPNIRPTPELLKSLIEHYDLPYTLEDIERWMED